MLYKINSSITSAAFLSVVKFKSSTFYGNCSTNVN